MIDDDGDDDVEPSDNDIIDIATSGTSDTAAAGEAENEGTDDIDYEWSEH